jgi:hypothetical protein
MATSLGDLLSAMQNGVNAINRLNTTIASIFPEVTANSTVAATAGAITFTSSQALGFMLVELSSGTTVKVPYYSE